jgi:translation initiation factor SUI1
MNNINNIDNLFNDEFDINTEDNNMLMNSKIHIKLVQRTGRKYITIIESLNPDLHKKFIKKCKKIFNTNGWISDNNIYLNGDNRDKVKDLLINKYNIEDDNIYIHGF